MKLVEFLVSGVNGAPNGSATFLLRGTASSAASVLYTDAEGTAQPGTNIITLDANGAAEIYCNAYVDVVLKTVGGSTLRTVTVMNTATTTEVISDSFTGTGYTGSPTAASQPITLSAILDKWNNSAGTLDWKVLVGGVSTNLSTAFSSIAGLFFNVKDPAFGALGDGVTDDTTAIGLAITAAAAAGGGIVFFPATTSFYNFTTLSVSVANITLMGAGPAASLLKSSTTASNLLAFTDNTAGAWKRVIGLGIQGTGANANPAITLENTQNVLFDNVNINTSTFTGTCVKRVTGAGNSLILFRGCQITLGASQAAGFENAGADDITHWDVTDCKFIVPVGFTNDVIIGPNFNVKGCIFDASAVTSGIYRHINSTSGTTAGKYLGRFVGNTFIDGGSTGFAFQLTLIATGSNFHEDCNVFTGFTDPSAITSVGQIYNVSHNSQDAYKVFLGSRVGRTIEITHASTGTVVLSSITAYQNVFVNYTAAGNLTIQAPTATMTNGAQANIVIQNNNASARTFVIDCGEAVKTYGSAEGSNDNGVAVNNDINVSVATTAGNTERFIFMMQFMHFGTDSPLAFVSGVSID